MVTNKALEIIINDKNKEINELKLINTARENQYISLIDNLREMVGFPFASIEFIKNESNTTLLKCTDKVGNAVVFNVCLEVKEATRENI